MAQLEMKHGDDRTLRIVVNGSNGRPYPWAGVTVWFTAKRSANTADSAAAIKKVGSRDLVDSDFDLTTDGIALAPINAADTKGLPNRTETYYYDVQIKRADGKIESVDEGTITIKQEITVSV